MDETSFESIVSAYYEPLYRFGYSLSQRESEACDLTQETFYRYATKGHQLRDKSKVKTWLFTTLYRQFIGQQRRDTRFPHVEVSAVDHELPGTSTSVARDADGNTAVHALANVSEIYRAPLVLLYLEDHSYQEIADALDIPIGTVMSRLARGKEQLRKLLADPIPLSARNITPLDTNAQRF